jgi:hypothetical protein
MLLAPWRKTVAEILERPVSSPLHGRRVGKPLAKYQRVLVDTLLPRLAVDITSPIPDAAALFAHQTDEAASICSMPRRCTQTAG